jgi:WD40 repeat protein
VNAVAFGQVEGRPVIASASNDQTVRVWDLDLDLDLDLDKPCGPGAVAAPVISISIAVYGIAIRSPDILAVASELGVIAIRFGRA